MARAELVWILALSPVPRLRNSAEALEHARKAVEMTKGEHPAFQTMLALAAYRSGLHDEALAALERAKALGGKEDATACFLLAMIHWQKGEKEEARLWFDKAVAGIKDQRSPGMYLGLLWTEAASVLGLPGPETGAVRSSPNRWTVSLLRAPRRSVWLGYSPGTLSRGMLKTIN